MVFKYFVNILYNILEEAGKNVGNVAVWFYYFIPTRTPSTFSPHTPGQPQGNPFNSFLMSIIPYPSKWHLEEKYI